MHTNIYKQIKIISMQTWINFFIFTFWLSIISFITNFNNFIRLLFYSELTWIILYCFILIQGAINDDIILLSTSIFILGLAGIEYAIGILILLIFKQINKKTNFDESDNDVYNHNIYSNNNIYINRYIWNN